MATDYDHDKRLDNLDPGEYRIWGDSHTVLVPVGKSITQPKSREIVPVNVKVSGEIKKGYFNSPLADFTNANVHVERFDKFYLGIFRTELPPDEDISWDKDLGIRTFHLEHTLTMKSDVFEGGNKAFASMQHVKDDLWISNRMKFNAYNLTHVEGTYRIVTENVPDIYGQFFDTGKTFQTGKLPIYIVVDSAKIVNGNSEMVIQLKNTPFPLTLDSFDFNLIGGE